MPYYICFSIVHHGTIFVESGDAGRRIRLTGHEPGTQVGRGKREMNDRSCLNSSWMFQPHFIYSGEKISLLDCPIHFFVVEVRSVFLLMMIVWIVVMANFYT